MKPRRSGIEEPQGDLFRIELERIVDKHQPLVELSNRLDWKAFEEKFGEHYDASKGRPGIPTRLMVGLHYLKYTYNLSDEEIVERWMENAYWQYFCGEKYFEYKPPIDPSSMTRWRKKVGVEGAEEMLKATITTAVEMKVVKSSEFKSINVDTTVQEKAITYPTDSKLYYRMRAKLVKAAKDHGIKLRQSYVRKAREALIMANRYFHARQHKRARRQVRKLKTYLRRVTNDIRRKIAGDRTLEEAFGELFILADRVLAQQQTDKNKLYSLHAPEVECISKGKIHKKYEFGNKVSIVSTSRKGLILGMLACHGNPYDGHTLQASVDQAERNSGRELDGDVFVDKGYRGHDYSGPAIVHVAGKKKLSRRLRRLMRRRSRIEADIGHMKNDSRLGRNFLLGKDGDAFNALMCGCAANLSLLIAQIYLWVFSSLFVQAQTVFFALFHALAPPQSQISPADA
jgi:IS5 family transposase